MNEFDRITKRIEDQQYLLDQDKERKKKKPNVLMEEETGEQIANFDFWCDVCQEDFISPAYKTKHRLYGDSVAVWRAQCPDCEEEAIRLITHKDEDPYYYKSTKIRFQRNQYATELLQADDYGFNSTYGNPHRSTEQMLEDQEKDILQKEEWGKGLKGKSLKTQEYLNKRNKKMQHK